jgi:hypothetical protein
MFVLLCFCLGSAAWSAAGGGVSSADPESFDYRDLPTEGWIEARITEASPQFDFKSGRSRYAAFRLPSSRSHFLVDIVSALEPAEDPAKSRVFYPSLALLSDSFYVVRASEGASWRFDLPEYGLTVTPGYRLTVDIDPAGPEKYLIVFTRPADLEGGLTGAADHGRLLIRVTPSPAN